jgi:hypothetical protein
MTTRLRTRIAKVGVATVVAAATLPLMAGPALANSFTTYVYQGKVSYDDGGDRFCARADEVNINDRAVIEVTLTPYNTSRGPTISFSDIDYSGATCRSLATAYEDTYYKAVIKSLTHFDRTGGSTYETTVVNFYS